MISTLLLALLVSPQAETMPVVLPLRERAALQERWLEERFETVVPALMRREGVDLWILIAREYNEDPVLETMLPPTWLAARRRTILVFHDGSPDADGSRVDRFAVGRYAVGESFRSTWDKDKQPDQLARLAQLVRERDPQRIAVNVSPDFALADGLSASEHEGLFEALGPDLAGRVVSGERLAIGWLETRTASELEVYPTICRIAHEILREGLSAAAVQPGFTTTEDLEWWFRERIAALRLDTWFHPSVSVQRDEGSERSGSFSSREGVRTIRRGDLVHVDFGITYLGLNTDTQQHAYVLRAGETEAPAGLRNGMRAANRVQDLLMEAFVEGRTGNEILRAALDASAEAGIEATIYTHPLGYHGHGAGPTIGLWDQQEGVPGRGDYPLFADTAYSIELNAALAVPEWGGKTVRFMLEEDAWFDGAETRFLDGRQEELFLIP